MSFRYTDRMKSGAHQFNQALSLDPLLWAAYEELCKLGMSFNKQVCKKKL